MGRGKQFVQYDNTARNADTLSIEAAQVSGQSPWTKTAQFAPLEASDTGLGAKGILGTLVRSGVRAAPVLLVLFADVVSLLVSAFVGNWLGGPVASARVGFSAMAWGSVYGAVLLVAYLFAGFYSNRIQSGPEELRDLTLVTTITVAVMALIGYATTGLFDVHGVTFFAAWLVALFTVPWARFAIRRLFAKRAWWGRKALVISSKPKVAERLVRNFRAQPWLGIQPAATLCVGAEASQDNGRAMPMLNQDQSVLSYAREHGIDYAIVTTAALEEPQAFALTQKYSHYFKHWLIMPDFPQHYSLWVNTRDLNGDLGLEVTNKLNRRVDRALKRTLDITATLLGGIFILPIGLAIALAIKLDSHGPVLFGHTRLGRNGEPFKVWKFRSMRENAGELLEEYLEKHPELRTEWEATHKLKNDPRVTRLGNFLRKTSLDEFPQLLNVLRGEMSLVGPRPVVTEEIAHYGAVWELYKRTRPGITGQWQVSGRSDTSYEERTGMDAYYVRNWSVWLDIYILAKTPAAVLGSDGAY